MSESSGREDRGLEIHISSSDRLGPLLAWYEEGLSIYDLPANYGLYRYWGREDFSDVCVEVYLRMKSDY